MSLSGCMRNLPIIYSPWQQGQSSVICNVVYINNINMIGVGLAIAVVAQWLTTPCEKDAVPMRYIQSPSHIASNAHNLYISLSKMGAELQSNNREHDRKM